MTTRRLAAIGVIDVVGYSRMMAEDEDGTHAALKAVRNELDPILLNHGGRIVKGTGDGLLVEVPSAVEAVEAAVEVQQLMAARNASQPEGRRMDLRIGINLGDVIVEDDGDLFGDGVNVAARLEGEAEPGGICVSGSVQSLVEGRVDCGFEDLGSVDVKNIPRPVQAWRVKLPVLSPEESSTSFAIPAVAVVPFTNMSHDAEQDYFADGITEDLITALSHHPELRVVSRSSSFAVRDQHSNLRELARELDATYVVEGSVRRAGNRVRVTAQLIEAETDYHIWADRFDREIDDIFSVQDEIVYAIASHIHPHLTRREVDKRQTASPEELDLWDLILRARAIEAGNSLEASAAAVRLLESARDRHPDSARVHIELALIWMTIAFNRWSIEGRKGWAEATRYSRDALRFDPNNPVSLTLMAVVHNMGGESHTARDLIARALARTPHDAMVLMAAGQVEQFLGEADRAVSIMTEAWRLAQHEPWSYHIAANMAFSHYLAGRYEAAWAWAQRGLEVAEYLQLRAGGAAALGMLGRTEEARRQIRYVIDNHPGVTVDRFLRNVHWDRTEDIDHYRRGLIKAGMPE